MPDSPLGFVRHELGLWVPGGSLRRQDESPAALRNSGVYLTHQDLTGQPVTEHDLIELLQGLSVEDVMGQVAVLTTRYTEHPTTDRAAQAAMIRRVAGPAGLAESLIGALDRDGDDVVILHQQQLVHLARLALIHCDLRPHDDFRGGEGYLDFLTCLIGVNDILEEGLEVEDPDQRLAWELRQCDVNHREDTAILLGTHHAIYQRLWPEIQPEGAREVETAFKNAVGLSFADFFVIGSGVQSRFLSHAVNDHDGVPLLNPREYFATVDLTEREWEPFFAATARAPEEMREELLDEEANYGKTTYGSLTFERWPLLAVRDEGYLPISMPALQRRFTQGVFHVLAEAAEEANLDRRYYTSRFGEPFQALVERSLRRGVAAADPALPIAADVEYGPRGSRRRSSDVVLGYPGHPIFVDAVSGPLQAATLTRGDLSTYERDAARLVVEKAVQLNARIAEFLAGDASFEDIDPTTASKVHPVVVTSHPFPRRDTIADDLDRRVRAAGALTDPRVDQLAILSAEELAYAEGLMEHRGDSFLALIRGWTSSNRGRHSFRNYAVEHAGGRAPPATAFIELWAETAAIVQRRLFGREVDVDQVLHEVKEGRAA
jgi:hypothetical protein